MARWGIGDIQGCCTELRELLTRIGYSADRDQLWFTGDLVNRGPESLAALRLVRSLDANATVVLGNHDLHLLAAALVPGHRLRAHDTLDEILAAPDREPLLNWLLEPFGVHHIAWLTTHAYGSVIVVMIWEWTPFMTLIVLAGLQGQGADVLEAAKVDVAGALATFRELTLPHLRPYIELGGPALGRALAHPLGACPLRAGMALRKRESEGVLENISFISRHGGSRSAPASSQRVSDSPSSRFSARDPGWPACPRRARNGDVICSSVQKKWRELALFEGPKRHFSVLRLTPLVVLSPESRLAGVPSKGQEW